MIRPTTATDSPVDLRRSTASTSCAPSPADLMAEYPVWSPDRTRIAFGDLPCIDAGCRYDIFVVGRRRRSVHRSSAWRSVTPIWSPDSRHLLSTASLARMDLAQRPSGYHIQTIELDGVGIAAGTSPVDVTPPSGGQDRLRLRRSQDAVGSRSPEARSRVSDHPQPDPAIWTVAADGTDPGSVAAVEAGDLSDWPRARVDRARCAPGPD